MPLKVCRLRCALHNLLPPLLCSPLGAGLPLHSVWIYLSRWASNGRCYFCVHVYDVLYIIPLFILVCTYSCLCYSFGTIISTTEILHYSDLIVLTPIVSIPIVSIPNCANPNCFNLNCFDPDCFDRDYHNPDCCDPSCSNPDSFNPKCCNPNCLYPECFNPDC